MYKGKEPIALSKHAFSIRLKEEVIGHTLKHREKTKEYHRAVLALRWVQGVIKIKTMDEAKGV